MKDARDHRQSESHTEDQLESVGDGEREEIAVGGRVHVRVANDNDARDDVADHPGQ